LATPVYGSSVTTVEPYALDRIDDRERHGHPRDLFALWFGANAETANFAVGILAVALYGASLRGAILGLIIGSIFGYTIVALASLDGPKYGFPQMVFSRRVFGTDGNAMPAILCFLAGVGWFSISTVFGSQAVAQLFHLPYDVALAAMLVVQIAIAVYGYNAIHAFERVSGIVSIAGYGTIAIVAIVHANISAPFNPHAPLAAGGVIGSIAFSASLAFAYSVGWAPSASDYSRYLPASSSPRSIALNAFSGGFLPSTTLMILGAAAATVVSGSGIASATPADTMALVAGGNPWLAIVGLTTVMIGTLSGNIMNLYSGALSALVAYDPLRRFGFALAVGGGMAALTIICLLLAGTTDPTSRFPASVIALAALAVGGLSFVAVHWTLLRWQAALAVGLLGGVLALIGTDATATAHIFGNFLSLLSTWAAPWAGVVIGTVNTSVKRTNRAAVIAWVGGIAAGVPFWQQSWFVGPIAAAHPQIGDISYFVGFAVALVLIRVLRG
jgi:NCS1 family nucleobase:cation symporter-1